ncbi:hypothetical protein GpartN1_g2040.t1 [Galdieria partita]|uniref:AMP-activated protein kinase glycogen-binding domain-containing protein n=1 Tax=Galdieria partita TaxID=83374 RepID=A0A9C7PU46_9RHOD|nr:hypothetical protein GpartN1_g2040.t1 [Galdieria partita]
MSSSGSSTIRNSQEIPVTATLINDTIKQERRNMGAKQLSPKKMGLHAYVEALRTDRVPCLFFYHAEAMAVAIAGDWTDWKTIHLQREESSGVNGVVIDVPVGTHIYKFVADLGNNQEQTRQYLQYGWQYSHVTAGNENVLESPYMVITIEKPPPPRGMRRISSSTDDGQTVQRLSPRGCLWMVFAACLGCAIGIALGIIHAARTADYNTLSNRTVPTSGQLFETPLPTRNSAVALVASLYLQLSCTLLLFVLMTEDYGIPGLIATISFGVTMIFSVTGAALDGYTTKLYIQQYHKLSFYIIGLLICDVLGLLDAIANTILSYVLIWLQRGSARKRTLTKEEIIYLLLAIASYFLADVSMSVRAPFVSMENPLHFNSTSIPGTFPNNQQGLSYSPEPFANSVVGLMTTVLVAINALAIESLLVFQMFSHDSRATGFRIAFVIICAILGIFYLIAAGLDIKSVLSAVSYQGKQLDFTSIEALVALDFVGCALAVAQSVCFGILKPKKK